ncbi:MAG: hypothetical protein GX443_03000 [Deltaproteobacteria bacterium]|nr:hypothetical protein [Deltaproteobacteria bacterium]
MGTMRLEEVAFVRFKLLIIMMKACLEDCPMGKFRRDSLMNNVRSLRTLVFNRNPQDTIPSWMGGPLGRKTDPLFYARMELLFIMAEAMESGRPLGNYSRQAVARTLSEILRVVHVKPITGDAVSIGVA